MNITAATALAAAIAAVIEIALLNPITLLRSQAFAGRRGRPQWRYAFGKGWRRGLPLQLVAAVFRRAFTFGGCAYLATAGVSGFMSGLLMGAVEGILLTPTRRLTFLQQVSRQHALRPLCASIVRKEGMRGLWLGAGVNTARMAACGAAYFGTLSVFWRFCPTIPAVVPGALAATASTIVANPFCLVLSRMWLGKHRPLPWQRWARGLRIALLRSVPGAALSYGLLHALAGFFAI